MLAVALGLCLAACGDEESPRAPTPSVTTQPHATDRLLGLAREQLVSGDPAVIQQAMVCEMGRLERALGAADARQRIEDVIDTVYTTPAEWASAQRLERLVTSRSFALSGGICDSINAVADRAAPLARTAAGR